MKFVAAIYIAIACASSASAQNFVDIDLKGWESVGEVSDPGNTSETLSMPPDAKIVSAEYIDLVYETFGMVWRSELKLYLRNGVDGPGFWLSYVNGAPVGPGVYGPVTDTFANSNTQGVPFSTTTGELYVAIGSGPDGATVFDGTLRVGWIPDPGTGDPPTPFSGPGGPIFDNDPIGMITPVVIEESFPIESIAVRINGFQHSYSSDLTIELRHVGVGEPVFLLTNLRFGEDADFDGDYTFADSGDDLWVVAQNFSGTEDLPPGTYQASGPGGDFISLDDAFVGQDAQGSWILRIYDDDFLVAGAFESWDLILGGVPPCPGDLVGDVNGDGAVDLDDLDLVLTQFGASCAL